MCLLFLPFVNPATSMYLLLCGIEIPLFFLGFSVREELLAVFVLLRKLIAIWMWTPFFISRVKMSFIPWKYLSNTCAYFELRKYTLLSPFTRVTRSVRKGKYTLLSPFTRVTRLRRSGKYILFSVPLR